MRWFPTPNENNMYLRCLKLNISKLWLPLQYIALSAHKSSDAIVLLNEVHREAKEWCNKEKYGGKSSRIECDILSGEDSAESKKTRRVRKGFNEGDEVENK